MRGAFFGCILLKEILLSNAIEMLGEEFISKFRVYLNNIVLLGDEGGNHQTIKVNYQFGHPVKFKVRLKNLIYFNILNL